MFIMAEQNGMCLSNLLCFLSGKYCPDFLQLNSYSRVRVANGIREEGVNSTSKHDLGGHASRGPGFSNDCMKQSRPHPPP